MVSPFIFLESLYNYFEPRKEAAMPTRISSRNEAQEEKGAAATPRGPLDPV